MANMREIRARISSVKNTQQITKAMKMVAAAKLRRTEGGMAGIRAFAQQSQEILDELLTGENHYSNRFLAPRKEVKRVCYVLFIGSRGLCGVYNHAILRYAQDILAQEKRDATVVVCGRWGRDVIAHAGLPVSKTFAELSDTPNMDEALQVSEYLKRMYLSGEADEIHLIYQHFRSALQQIPSTMQLLPATPERSGDGTANDYIFEPDAESILENVMQLYLNNTVLSVMLEAKVGEQAARMTAMSTATDATTELIGELSLKMNRARQAAITTEIAEIVGGANALKKAKK
ncbi:MAG: ATP synthase F1 subunit gamma [Clostridiales bacterium]|nr:ATP synthase F1 subunit gamma [Candidatus Cacconaster stercorequi]